jgi:hypothetical protein
MSKMQTTIEASEDTITMIEVFGSDKKTLRLFMEQNDLGSNKSAFREVLVLAGLKKKKAVAA